MAADSGRTILVVDDQADVASALSVFLRYSFQNVEVRAAHSAADALEVLRSQRVDLVVADYRMPGIQGAQFLEAIGQAAPGVPRIVFTGHMDEASRELVDQADRILPKSAALEDLAADVQGLLGRPN